MDHPKDKKLDQKKSRRGERRLLPRVGPFVVAFAMFCAIFSFLIFAGLTAWDTQKIKEDVAPAAAATRKVLAQAVADEAIAKEAAQKFNGEVVKNADGKTWDILEKAPVAPAPAAAPVAPSPQVSVTQ